MAIEMAVELANNDLLSMALFRLVLFANQIFSDDLCLRVFVGTVDSGDTVLVLEIGRPSYSIAVFLCILYFALYAKLANFVETATGLQIIIGRCQAGIEKHILILDYLFG
jgi:hypothetical protein